MQFKVPQNVQREDRIVGPLTLRQLIICGAGGGIAYAVYVSLGKDYLWITWAPPVAIIVMITILFAFIKPLDMTFSRFLLTFLEFRLLPQKRFWIQSSGEVQVSAYTANKPKSSELKKAEEKANLITDRARKLKEITKIVDNQGKN